MNNYYNMVKLEFKSDDLLVTVMFLTVNGASLFILTYGFGLKRPTTELFQTVG
ncbi:hypothetical protein [uncultured Desulfuromonas sp.]|uniref:hypothetical protein n=1 Tax=uncultured Desulfuromonas sp. TaxID=181013 RepID=UPI002AAAD5E6|nr:hypothetical protein [uncultured Desulfuromonas sp.]